MSVHIWLEREQSKPHIHFFYFLHSRTIAYIFVHFPLDPMVAHDQTSLHNTKAR